MNDLKRLLNDIVQEVGLPRDYLGKDALDARVMAALVP